MNTNDNNFDLIDDELQDKWLTDNLKLTHLEPSKEFTQTVVEQVVIKPDTIGSSPLIWILILSSGIFLAWITLSVISALGNNYHLEVTFLSKISNTISIYVLSKYLIMTTVAVLFFVGLDHFLTKHLAKKQSFFSFIFV